jgi:hypothetical protein
MERREFPRHRAGWTAVVGHANEHVMPSTDVVDMSLQGALLVFDEPVGVTPEERLVVSLSTPAGKVHLISRVVRSARGTDFRSYVAVRFEEIDRAERDHLAGLLEALDA